MRREGGREGPCLCTCDIQYSSTSSIVQCDRSFEGCGKASSAAGCLGVRTVLCCTSPPGALGDDGRCWIALDPSIVVVWAPACMGLRDGVGLCCGGYRISGFSGQDSWKRADGRCLVLDDLMRGRRTEGDVTASLLVQGPDIYHSTGSDTCRTTTYFTEVMPYKTRTTVFNRAGRCYAQNVLVYTTTQFPIHPSRPPLHPPVPSAPSRLNSVPATQPSFAA
jgi:hypothetical protein